MTRQGKSSGGTGIAVAALAGVVLALANAHPSPAGASLTAALASPAASTASANEALGERMAAARGWAGRQGRCLNWLWTRESGWQIVWNYQGSGAYGIPQSLPAGKMAAAGADWRTDPRTEIRWGLSYIRGTYGTPCVAWGHEEADGWY